jgi:alpha-beta hydrolase superfamily lysophospholipase
MIEETQLKTSDGLKLYAWVRGCEAPPKAVIALVHGMGEHSRRYDHLTEYWETQGYASAGFDQRGHGRSDGVRGHTPSYDHLMEDIAVFLEETAATWPGVPIVLYGHSMGGNLVLNYAIRRRPDLACVIATAPYLRLAFEPPAWRVRMAEWMKDITPDFSQKTGLKAQALSRDPEVVSRYEQDPLVHGQITVSFFSHVHRAGETAIERASEIGLPALLMHGDADTITSPAGAEAFVAASSGKATLKLFEGFYHEIHNEPGWTDVAAFALDWIDAKSKSRQTGLGH